MLRYMHALRPKTHASCSSEECSDIDDATKAEGTVSLAWVQGAADTKPPTCSLKYTKSVN